MPSPQPSGTLKRPTLATASSSSSSSLSGMEMAIPSFQSFLRRTPTPDPLKPLPPTPLRPRRPSSLDSGSSPAASQSTRRSSSVYSRTASQYDPTPNRPGLPSWRTADFAEQNLLLRPVAYSASTSQLLQKTPAQPAGLEPRTYNPVTITPPTTGSRVPTPSPPPLLRPSVLLPPPVSIAQISQKHLRAVSLEKAKAIMQAPGAVHLLPEELRAQTLSKSRSQEPLRLSSVDVVAGGSGSPRLPQAPTLVDSQGRERLVKSPTLPPPPTSCADYPYPAVVSPLGESTDVAGTFHVGNQPVKPMAPLAQYRIESRAKAAQALGLADADERRGRTKTRGPRNLSYEHYLPKQRRPSDMSDKSDDIVSDAQKIAQEYHAVLSEQYRQSSPASQGSGSSVDIRTHMKLVPKPLFHPRPAARLPDADESGAPFMLRDDGEDHDADDYHSNGSRGSLPLRLGTPESQHMRCSTSGSIPISPPDSIMSAVSPPVTESRTVSKRPKPKAIRQLDDNRASAYYPHVMSRKPKRSAVSNRSSPLADSKVLNKPMLAADIIAERERLGSSEGTPDILSLRSSRSMSSLQSGSMASTKSSMRLRERMLSRAVLYADKLKKPAGTSRWRAHDKRRASNEPSSPDSSHLLPSPSSPKPALDFHLGWSDQAKDAFDSSRSSVNLPKRPANTLVTHLQTPAQPLNESKAGLEEPESPGRKGSIFSGLMDGWRETKAEKRREDLKKMIKHVGTDVIPGVEVTTDRRPSLIVRRLSAYGWIRQLGSISGVSSSGRAGG
ncbi:hypothetical protein BAUCODRAFT_534884 [Baudoinia panamericana UAMH 10762]|uniref:Uncharacterized protein n=1 Tax=Baudoinia panamericana (strain UAMH 10762) TaxID=717646 RepID=M2N884_BAUPA|nr:uncharacterized protein BAUCODRAFT_534884 [Baudoinia panamericana UAMH 10762]EMC95304.1 hypothetical protein BAUCODRAFT_534884 [Baudoinia panamericana UAMH 10762]